MKLLSTSLIYTLTVIFLVGCCINSKVPLEGDLGPYHLKTNVDSDVARYYVENYLTNKKTNSKLDAELDQLCKEFYQTTPDRERLKEISQKYSLDFAALFWANHILSLEKNKSIQQKYIQDLASVQKGDTKMVTSGYVVILAPGFDYEANGPITGADLKTQIELFKQLGVELYFAKIPTLGTVEENASVIADEIKKHSDKKILIGGPSSAGPAIHLALAKKLTEVESKQVVVWLSLGGVINGSPALDWIDSGITSPIWSTILWFKDWKKEAFTSLRADVSRKRAESLQLPSHIKVISYIGLSLSSNISKFAKDKYCIMKSEGPNDGLGLLPDMVVPNSYTIIAPESDHFFAENPQIKNISVALLKTSVQLMLEK